MDDLQEKLNGILADPNAMGQIMNLARSMGLTGDTPEKQNDSPEPPLAPVLPFDTATLQTLSGLAGQSEIDAHQKTLLKALQPYLSSQRLTKLEKAMRAAKIAALASQFLGNAQFFSGR